MYYKPTFNISEHVTIQNMLLPHILLITLYSPALKYPINPPIKMRAAYKYDIMSITKLYPKTHVIPKQRQQSSDPVMSQQALFRSVCHCYLSHCSVTDCVFDNWVRSKEHLTVQELH